MSAGLNPILADELLLGGVIVEGACDLSGVDFEEEVVTIGRDVTILFSVKYFA